MLKKSELRNGLLEHTNTPPQGMTYSLAQRFLCRRTSILPVCESLLRQSLPPVEVVCEELLDKTASKELVLPVPWQFSYTKPTGGERWSYGKS